MSDAAVISRSPIACSGLMYCGVPSDIPVSVMRVPALEAAGLVNVSVSQRQYQVVMSLDDYLCYQENRTSGRLMREALSAAFEERRPLRARIADTAGEMRNMVAMALMRAVGR